MTAFSTLKLASVLLAGFAQLVFILPAAPAFAQGPLSIPAAVHGSALPPHGRTHTKVKSVSGATHTHIHHYPGGVRLKSLHAGKKSKKAGPPPKPPQDFVGSLSVHTVAPGVVHKVHRGSMFINVLDVDLTKANLIVKPVLAGESFNKLDEVRDQAQKVAAIAAVNGNYFKRDGTPLGTLIIDGEWIAGPLFDRTCMGITRDGRILVDRVTLHGTLSTSNPEAPTIWVNNVNQPRRHGAHLIAYTRRWGDEVKMQYEGTLLAVDYTGHVVARAGKELAIPPGGYVLSDSKKSAIAKLNIGDTVRLTWQPSPAEWYDVVNAVSGGPVLIRDGNLFVDCKDERFSKSWTGSQIHARTAVGVTANRHLVLATIEGPHTLWDVAKFLKKLGCVDAMNLDGGGSTTMVVDGRTVTRNRNKFERRVASALAVLPRSAADATCSTAGQDAQALSELGIKTYGTLNPAAMPATNGGGNPLPPSATPAASTAPAQAAPVSVPADAAAALQSGLLPDVLQGALPATRYVPLTTANPAAATRHGRFGWIKHLNPLR